jgi:peptidoglycan hydrolase-like protein with peptidoglycan-binding domain
VARLLLDLGYLDRDGFGDDSARNAAIRNAERDHGLPRTGRPTPALLAKLLAEARRNFLPPPKVSRVVTRQGRPSTD